MKIFKAMLLAAAMVLSFTACGGEKETEAVETVVETETQTEAAETVVETETQTETAAGTDEYAFEEETAEEEALEQNAEECLGDYALTY